ncbi:MAG: DUF5663 domain-containing protein [Patescibacteria group bacterium]|nr:DUF5663 domain-containing protein [Patescibacteria group bacterium]
MLEQTKNILQNLGITNKIAPETREKLLPKIGELLEKRMLIALTLAIPEDKKQEAQDKISKNEPGLVEYLQSIVPDCDEILKRTIDKFKAEIDQML